MFLRAVILIINAILFSVVFQRQLFYQRVNDSGLPHLRYNLPKPNVIDDDGIHVLHFEYPGSKMMLFHFHGNGATVESSFWHYSRLYHELKVDVIGMEYNGWGKLHHYNPSQKDIMFHLAKSFTKVRVGRKKVVFLGASLGTGPAIGFATLTHEHFQPDVLILENPFTSVADVFKIPSFLIWDQWNNLEEMKYVHCKTLFITSEDDEIISPKHSLQLLNAVPKHLRTMKTILEKCNHGDAPAHPKYLQAIKACI